MRKSSLIVVSVALLLLCFSHQVRSQQSRVAEREAEWDQYPPPQTTFVRQLDPSKAVLFRVPNDWKQEPDKLVFSGPHNATLTLFIGKIPDGMPLREYVSALMQPLRSLPEGADSLVVRRTTMAALEAREIMFESADGEEVTRRVIWSTVSGPNSVSVVLISPIANAAEIEPYFKAVIQSVTFVDNHDYAGFDALRSWAIKDPKPLRVDEVQSLATSLTALEGSTRQASITRLASIFASSPETAIDLVLDGRPMVRAAVFEAIAQSRNKSLEKFLLRALEDREPFVAEKAARSLAASPGVIDLLRTHSFDWFKIESIARVWPFLNSKNRITILEEVFARPLVPASVISKLSPKAEASPVKPGVTVRAVVLSPGSPLPAEVQALTSTSDPTRYRGALTLIHDLPPSEFKLPLNAILAAKNDTLTTLALQIAWDRDEHLPSSELLKLLSSSNHDVRLQAAWGLGRSGSVADIKSIESHLSKQAPGAVAVDPVGNPSDPGFALNDALQFAISKIRFREQLSTASGDARQQLITKNVTDPRLAAWIWYDFVRENVDRETNAGESNARPGPPVALPLGENLFPKEVTYYAALPHPGNALDKLGNAFAGLQLASARSQANFVLILSSLREQLAQQLDSPPGAAPIDYSGINTKEPIAMASWFAAGARAGIVSAERKAIILRVTDRARFERSLTLYQRSIGNFRRLTDYFSGGVRFITLVPTFLPLSAKAMLEGPLTPKKEPPLLKYSFVGGTEWKGYSIRVVAQRTVDSSGRFTGDAAYLTYLGDTAVLAPDLASLCDVLRRASSEQQTLAANSDFRRVAETPGEAIYLSNLGRLFASSTEDEISKGKGIMIESGALKISNSTWENLYQIKFSQSDWLKPFIGFQPEGLVSPRVLLPRATVAYYFMNFDTAAGWRDWSTDLLSVEMKKNLASIWSIDFEKEVLPELGPECGVAVLGLPDVIAGTWDLPWAVFFKLKSDKLDRALVSGKLLTGTSAGAGPTHIKLKSGDLFVVVKDGFLVLANTSAAIVALDQKEKLISSRDFSRAAKQAPVGVVAFGGYSLEAAIAAIGDSGGDPFKSQQSSLISSLTNAFHSPNFYATATSDAVQGRFSLSMDREGRFSVSELSSLSKEYRLTYAQVEARGVPIQNQERLSSLKLRIRASAAGQIDRLKEDVATTHQIVEKASDNELELKVLPRQSEPKASLALPIKGAEFAQYLQPSKEIRADDKSVIDKAREIAGDERDAWKVARKLADWTYNNIKWKRVDDATAAQTLATLEADCLEFSQLYVAMARSLGLPARMVSGLAYSGESFGGHAWVEVYVGDWIEVDPTWGTHYVDATHIRNSADGALLTYASLNLVEFEVLEAPRGVAEFQKDPQALAAKLSQELPTGNLSALTAALDLAVLTDENVGLGTWESFSDSERDVMSSFYRRLLLEISTGFRIESNQTSEMRLLKVKENGERAEAVVMHPGDAELLVKLMLVRRNGAWFLTEILQSDTDLHIISEALQPTIKTILDRRNNKSARGRWTSDFARVLLAMAQDPKVSLAIADRALKDNPKHRGLRHLKAWALVRSEKEDDAIQLWKELAEEPKPFAPALLSLARQYDVAEDQPKQKLAIEFYTRYSEAEPEDPRAHVALAQLYDINGDDERAEAEHRAALRSDPSNTGQFVEFAGFLAVRKRFKEAASIIDEGGARAKPDDDLFGDLMSHLYYQEDKTAPEELALSQPHRMDQSATANLYLAYVRLENGGSLRAMPLLRKAVAMKNDWAEPFGAMSNGYRTLGNWPAALKAADTAIKLDPSYSNAHFSRACALARLGRFKEALQSLEKTIELNPVYSAILGEEDDLKALASRPAFKKLLPAQENKQ